MRKIGLLWMLISVIILSSCVEPSLDYLEFTLNPGNDTTELNAPYQDPGATAMYGFKVLTVDVITNTVDVTTLGVYEIIYQATYGSLTQTLKRVVTVIDETAPTLALNPGIDTIKAGTEWIDAGVTMSDNSGLPIDLVVIGDVGSTPGVYVIRYVATDAYQNQSQIQRVVYVIE